ncbi:MAG: hypothetical protein EXR98_21075 [Gemmataceae bacterium]|nr:hypothetical protein [Gemmataceae bacterium]
MASVRQVIRSGLWGILGPVVLSIILAAIFGPFRYDNTNLDALVITAFTNVFNVWPLYLIQALLGLAYGEIRGLRGASSWPRGMLVGGIVWAIAGVPFLLGGAVLALMASAMPHGGPSFFESFLAIFGWYAGHVLCGVVAGIQVETYLLRCDQSAPPAV